MHPKSTYDSSLVDPKMSRSQTISSADTIRQLKDREKYLAETIKDLEMLKSEWTRVKAAIAGYENPSCVNDL